jgi:hypothetical protein
MYVYKGSSTLTLKKSWTKIPSAVQPFQGFLTSRNLLVSKQNESEAKLPITVLYGVNNKAVPPCAGKSMFFAALCTIKQ